MKPGSFEIDVVLRVEDVMDYRLPHYDVELTPRAIDRTSTICWQIYRERRRRREGLYTWLARVSDEAIRSGQTDG